MNEPIVNGAPYRTPAKRFGHDHLEAAIVEARAAATSLRKHAEAHPSALGVAHAYAAATRHIERLLTISSIKKDLELAREHAEKQRTRKSATLPTTLAHIETLVSVLSRLSEEQA